MVGLAQAFHSLRLARGCNVMAWLRTCVYVCFLLGAGATDSIAELMGRMPVQMAPAASESGMAACSDSSAFVLSPCLAGQMLPAKSSKVSLVFLRLVRSSSRESIQCALGLDMCLALALCVCSLICVGGAGGRGSEQCSAGAGAGVCCWLWGYGSCCTGTVSTWLAPKLNSALVFVRAASEDSCDRDTSQMCPEGCCDA